MDKNIQNDGKKGGSESSEGTGVHAGPNPDSAPGQSSASSWDMNRTKPSGNDSKPTDNQPTQKSGKETEQPGVHNPPPGQGAQNEPPGEAQKAQLGQGDQQHNIPGSTQDGEVQPK